MFITYERALSRPSAGPDTTAIPTTPLLTPKHPEEEGPYNTAALKTTISTRVPAAREHGDTSNPLQGLLFPLIFISPLLLLRACHPSSVRHRKTYSYSSDNKEVAAAQREHTSEVIGLKTRLSWARTGSILTDRFPQVRGYWGKMKSDQELAGTVLLYCLLQ
ncbi:hypothetical protein JOQ06_005202 [Pogonophryne albipinna]|uniref:Uncharacterized protein n=1 Tax=Pogonophryne albipinna TaxID=1090488 RepID=A0AAD6FP66_9TELE|nr:hypothetical protein JOQ06_005202 [Pogonophryne albipinna]